MPWKKRTPQEEGLHFERKELTKRGVIVHSRSGAGNIKEDGHDENFTYEVKNTSKKSFSLKASDLKTTFVRAARQGKLSVWLIHFEDQNFTVECRLVPDTTLGIIDE